MGAFLHSRNDPVVLTEDGRRLVEQHIAELEGKFERLTTALNSSERSTDVVADYQRTTRELERLRSLLATAQVLDQPADPRIVELGDEVTIRLDDSSEETYIVVHGLEAAVDDHRISAESPLGRTLLGRRVGDDVDVEVPGGAYQCTILRATRQESGTPS